MSSIFGPLAQVCIIIRRLLSAATICNCFRSGDCILDTMKEYASFTFGMAAYFNVDSAVLDKQINY